MATVGKPFGSTASLLPINADTIPKEYHRRVLKKIAQLTKVVYSLHTKNDENEELIEALKAEHDKEKEQLQSDCDTRLKQWHEERSKTRDLQTRMSDLQREKETLAIEHSAFVDDAEKKFQSIVEKNICELSRVTVQISSLENELALKDKKCSELHKQLKDSKQEAGNMASALNKEIETLKHQNQITVENFKQQLRLLEESHKQALTHAIDGHNEEMKTLQDRLLNEKDTAAEAKLQMAEEKYKSLEIQLSSHQSGMQGRLSTLSAELAKTKDELAISQQKERDLINKLNENAKLNQDEKALLVKEQERVFDFQRKLNALQKHFAVMEETCDTQNEEMKTIKAHVEKLETVKTQLEDDNDRLCLQLSESTNKLNALKEMRSRESKGHKASSEELSMKVCALEEEIEALTLDKKHLHAQYAREIEAAHSSLSENEATLAEKHSLSIQQIEEKHRIEMDDFKMEKEREITALMDNYQSSLSDQESSTSQKYSQTIGQLTSDLTSKTQELSLLRDELDNIRSTLSDKEGDLKSAVSSNEKLREQLMVTRQQANDSKKQKDNLGMNVTELQAMLDSLRNQHDQTLIAHKAELARTKTHVKQETEALWRNTMKSELSKLKTELKSRHCEEKENAVNKMAEQANIALTECEAKWQNENTKLIQQIKTLEEELKNLKFSSKAGILQIENQCQQQIEELNRGYAQQLIEADLFKQELLSSHSNEIETLKNTLGEQKKRALDDMTAQHRQEVLLTCQANHVALEAVKHEMLNEAEKEREGLKREHQSDIEVLHCELNKEFEAKLKEVQLHWDKECANLEQAAQTKMETLNFEISQHKTVQTSLENQLSECKSEASVMKQKVTVLNIELNDKRKELEMKKREIWMTSMEAKNELKLREEQLNATHHAELESLICQNKHQSQLVINEFNKAKEILTRKIDSTEKRLEEADFRYKNRGPRPEDVAAIRELTSIVKEQERKMKDLITERKMYQMELVNREKNYNQVFSANPQIGVLDPLKRKKKSIAPSSATRHSQNASSLTQSQSGTNSLPNIISSSTIVDNRDYTPFHLCKTPPPSFASSVQDLELPGLSPSPQFLHRIPFSTSSPSPVVANSKRKLKFLSNSGNELLPERTDPKNTGVPLQKSFTNSVVA